MLAQLDFPVPFAGLRDVRDRLLRPAIGFEHPSEVLRDPFLDDDGKRAILSSWASDACAVENWPTLRWLFGTPRPVPLTEVLEARRRLDEPETAAPQPMIRSQTRRGNDGPDHHAR
jgi:hypothetical protein